MKLLALSVGVVSLTIIVGCGSSSQEQVDAQPIPTVKPAAPFFYKVVKHQQTTNEWGQRVEAELETTNEVARKATEDDLRKLWVFMVPEPGEASVSIKIRTPVPGVEPWGTIHRFKPFGKWRVDVHKFEYGVDAQPYHFIDKIDRSVESQRTMILTLPMVNRIVEQVKRRGWTVTQRTVNSVRAEDGMGIGATEVSITPDNLQLFANTVDDVEFMDTAVFMLDELGIGEHVKRNFNPSLAVPNTCEPRQKILQDGIGVSGRLK